MQSSLDGLFLQERLAELQRTTEHGQLASEARLVDQAQQGAHRHAAPRLWLGAWLTHLGQACIAVGGRCQI